jgi:hypothetical protein
MVFHKIERKLIDISGWRERTDPAPRGYLYIVNEMHSLFLRSEASASFEFRILRI